MLKRAKEVETRLSVILDKSLKDNRFNLSMSCITALAQINYEKNQEYTSDYLEKALEKIKYFFSDKICVNNLQNNKIVLFYDGMGQDTRGLALVYLEAISKYADKIIYITNQRAQNKQPTVVNLLKNHNAIIEYVPEYISHTERMYYILSVFQKYKPSKAFMYTLPYDVSGVLAFMLCEGTIRYQIDFTDHAFWLGINSFDYCIEFRDYGATIAAKYRKINIKKIIMLPFYPKINKTIYKGLNFDIQGKKLIFSGGALYKTYSEDRLFYKIVEGILNDIEDVVFYYAGKGDTKEIFKLMNKYPKRVFYSEERDDFFDVIKRSSLYLNTYPLLGGLMTQYAIAAGKLPITLMHDQDAIGFLRNPERLSFFYEDYKTLINDVKKMLSDENYLKNKEKELVDCLMTKTTFDNEVVNILNNNKGNIKFTMITINLIRIHEEYLTRFSFDKIVNAIAKIRNYPLLWYFPYLFLVRLLRK